MEPTTEENKYLEQYPNPLIITRQTENSYYESKIFLKNITNDLVLFKLYCTKQHNYSVKQSSGSIKPGEVFEVVVRKLVKKSDESHKGTEKFLVVACPSKENCEDKELLKDIIKKTDFQSKNNQEIVIDTQVNDEVFISQDKLIDLESKLRNIDLSNFDESVNLYKALNKEYKLNISMVQKKIEGLGDQLRIISKNKFLQDKKEKGKCFLTL